MTAIIPTEQPQQPIYNRATRRHTMLEARKILKWNAEGYTARAIAHKLKFPNVDNGTNYVEEVLKFFKKPI